MINSEGKNEYRSFDVLPNLTIYQLKQNLSNFYGIPYDQMELLLNDHPLNNQQVVGQAGIGDNLITIRNKANAPITQSMRTPNITGSIPNITSSMRAPNINSSIPNITQSMRAPNINQSQNIYGSQFQNLGSSLRDNQNLLGLSSNSAVNDILEYNNLNSNIDTPEVQRKILQMIQNKRINDNLRQGIETMPESLFPVHMLFINIEMNNKKVNALVDTGAQSSFMSVDLCRKCNLMNMVDKRFQGIARGVGASKIIGVIHAAQIKIMNKVIMLKINIIENNEIGFVLGLDNLRKYNCNVDLKKNGLVFPDIGITAPFLSDGEIRKIRENRELEEEKEEIERAKLESLNYH